MSSGPQGTVLMAEEQQEPKNFNMVLNSEPIFYGTLVHSMASISLCKMSEVEGEPESGHHVNCYVFLDRKPLSPPNSKTSGSFSKTCIQSSHLIIVFNEVRNLSSVIDLISYPQLTAGPMETESLDPQNPNAHDHDE